ncbi:MAG: ankyrin repeat domain-containing protein, partial [Treponemataceae bacterium]|nr:ankyrin repeat domain-containing protein [Treponemataceae bacterium]
MNKKYFFMIAAIFMLACSAGTAQIMNKIINKAVGEMFKDSKPEELLKAAEENNVAEIERLIKKGTNINTKSRGGDTPLMKTVVKNHNAVDAAMVLIKAGADVNAENNALETPLMIAADFNSLEIAKALIDAGADVNLKDDKGNTALMYTPRRT